MNTEPQPEKKKTAEKFPVWRVFIMGGLYLSLIVFVILGLIIYTYKRSETRNQVYEHMETLAESQENALNQWMKSHFDKAAALATDARAHSMNANQANEAIQEYLQKWEGCENLAIIGTDGIRIAPKTSETINLQKRDYFQNALNGTRNISGPLISKTSGDVTIVLATPILDGEKIVGVLTALIPIKPLEEALHQAAPGVSGDIYLVDKNGVMVTSSRFDDSLKTTGLIQERSAGEFRVDTFAEYNIRKGENGCAEYNDILGNKVIGAYRYMPEYDWGLIIEQQTAEAFTPATSLRKALLTYGIIAAILVVGATLGIFLTFLKK